MTRIKAPKQALMNIPDWPAADQLVKELSEITRSIAAANLQATKDTETVKQWLTDTTKPLQERQAYITKSLEEFALGHTKDFGEARSRKLDFGIIGWRLSTWIEVAATTLEAIKAHFTKDEQKACIRVRETVDKEALAKLKDEKLAIIKARRKNKDAFFVEPLLTEAADKTS